MRRLVSTAVIIAIGLTPLAAKPAAAQGYQIDCAILLCLAGGWPPSVPCARARGVYPPDHALAGRTTAADLALSNAC